MEKQRASAIPPDTAQAHLHAARRAHDASVGRALAPAGIILAVSAFCGEQTVAPVYRGPGDVASIVAVLGLLASLVALSARHRWRSWRLFPTARWNAAEGVLIAVAVLVGGVLGPHLLASHGRGASASWGLGAVVATIVGGCLSVAQASYRRRGARAWSR